MPRTKMSEVMSKLVGAEIRRSRIEQGLTQSALAERLDVSKGYVTNVEAGRTNITVGQLAAFATALQAGVDLHLVAVEREPIELAAS